MPGSQILSHEHWVASKVSLLNLRFAVIAHLLQVADSAPADNLFARESRHSFLLKRIDNLNAQRIEMPHIARYNHQPA